MSSWLRVFERIKGDSKCPPEPGAGCRGIAREQPELEKAGALIAMLMGDECSVRGGGRGKESVWARSFREAWKG